MKNTTSHRSLICRTTDLHTRTYVVNKTDATAGSKIHTARPGVVNFCRRKHALISGNCKRQNLSAKVMKKNKTL